MYRAKCVGALIAVSIAFPVFALIGMQSSQTLIGGICGMVMGSLIGYCAAAGTIGRVTVGGILGASIYAIVGPGTDVPGLFAAPMGAVIGCAIGYAGWPWIAGFLGAHVGLLLGMMWAAAFVHWPWSGPSPGQCQLIGMLTSGVLTVVVGYLLKARVSAFFKPPTRDERQSPAAPDRLR